MSCEGAAQMNMTCTAGGGASHAEREQEGELEPEACRPQGVRLCPSVHSALPDPPRETPRVTERVAWAPFT